MKQRFTQFFSAENVTSFVALNLATLANARENPDTPTMTTLTPSNVEDYATWSNSTLITLGVIFGGACCICACWYGYTSRKEEQDEIDAQLGNRELDRLYVVTDGDTYKYRTIN